VKVINTLEEGHWDYLKMIAQAFIWKIPVQTWAMQDNVSIPSVIKHVRYTLSISARAVHRVKCKTPFKFIICGKMRSV